MESTLYSFNSLVVSYHKTYSLAKPLLVCFMILHNLRLKTSCMHFPGSNLYFISYCAITCSSSRLLWQEYPTLTTYFDGEIIGERHPFLTRKWVRGCVLTKWDQWTFWPLHLAYKQFVHIVFDSSYKSQYCVLGCWWGCGQKTLGRALLSRFSWSHSQSSKSIFSQPFIEKCINDTMRIWKYNQISSE